MHPPTPVQRIRRWHTYLVVWTVHRVIGLAVGILLILMSVTGGLLVLHHELERWLYPDYHVVQNNAGVPPAPGRQQGDHLHVSSPDRPPLAPLVQRLAAAAPAGYRPLRLEPGNAADESDKLVFVAPDSRTRWSVFVDPYTGKVLWSGPDDRLFTPWLLNLHMHLHVGPWGYLVTGLGGGGLLILGLTGLYIYRDRLSALWRHPMRLNRGWRVAMSDLHRWLGVVSIYFTIILGLTGSIYSFRIFANRLSDRPALAAPFALSQLAPIEPAIATAREHFPTAEPFRIAFPRTSKAPLTVTMLHRDAPVWRKFSRIDFDPATGALLHVRDARDASAGDQFASTLGPLHFGLFGSTLTKILYAIGGFAPAVLSVTGFAIWWLRTRRPATVPNRDATPSITPAVSGLPTR